MFSTHYSPQTAALSNPSNKEFIEGYRDATFKGQPIDVKSAPPEISSFINETQQLAQEFRARQQNVTPFPKGKVPVWLVGVNANARGGITSLSHSYVAAGDPGQGKKAHPTYFSRSSDEKRGGLSVDANFLAAAKAKCTKEGAPFFHEDALAALGNVELKKYPSKEAFFFAYAKQCQKLDREIKLSDVINEYIQLTFIGTEKDMEVWIREPNGFDAKKPNLAERDIRTFQNPWGADENSTAKKMFQRLSREEKTSGNAIPAGSMSIRCIPKADILNLVEARQQELIERLYGDELHNRNGTLVPPTLFELPSFDIPLKNVHLEDYRTYRENKLDEAGARTDEMVNVNADKLDERLAIFSANKQTYEFAPEEGNEKGINCNTGAKSILTDSGLSESDVMAATPFQVALHNEARTWHPVSSELALEPEESIRGDNMMMNRKNLANKLQNRDTYAARMKQTDSVFRWAEQGISELKAKYQINENQPGSEGQEAVQRLLNDPKISVSKIIDEKRWAGDSDSDGL